MLSQFGSDATLGTRSSIPSSRVCRSASVHAAPCVGPVARMVFSPFEPKTSQVVPPGPDLRKDLLSVLRARVNWGCSTIGADGGARGTDVAGTAAGTHVRPAATGGRRRG
jgi:hypothetical protein